MLIPSDQITDWNDLQGKVCQLFREMGYYAETERPVDLGGRGKKNIDVYIRDDRASVNQIMLVECKWWASSVPQEVVHSMQAIMHNSGANTGFIISKKGFQRGAHEATVSTNIHLMTWEEIQRTFGKQWHLHQAEKLAPILAEIRGIDFSHLDQGHTTIPISNNMIFHTEEQTIALMDVLRDMRVAQFAGMAQPKTFDEVPPITVSVHHGFPGSIKDANGLDVLQFGSVRAFYGWLGPWAQSLILKYRDLCKQARVAFDALPERKQQEAFQQTLSEIAGETPIRAFRQMLGDSEYFALLHKLGSKGVEPSIQNPPGAGTGPGSV